MFNSIRSLNEVSTDLCEDCPWLEFDRGTFLSPPTYDCPADMNTGAIDESCPRHGDFLEEIFDPEGNNIYRDEVEEYCNEHADGKVAVESR